MCARCRPPPCVVQWSSRTQDPNLGLWALSSSLATTCRSTLPKLHRPGQNCAGMVREDHLLRRADGAGSHAHTQGIRAGFAQPRSLPACDHVAADDVQPRAVRLDPLQHLQLVRGVPCSARAAAVSSLCVTTGCQCNVIWNPSGWHTIAVLSVYCTKTSNIKCCACHWLAREAPHLGWSPG